MSSNNEVACRSAAAGREIGAAWLLARKTDASPLISNSATAQTTRPTGQRDRRRGWGREIEEGDRARQRNPPDRLGAGEARYGRSRAGARSEPPSRACPRSRRGSSLSASVCRTRPITPEVAGSSSIAPVLPSGCKSARCRCLPRSRRRTVATAVTGRPRTRRGAATTRMASSAGTRRVNPPIPPAGRTASGRGTSRRCRAPRRRAGS